MILDNEIDEDNLKKVKKVHHWLQKYTHEGALSVVTGYFTIGALAFLSRETNHKIEKYRFILGDIVNFDTNKERALDLLNEEINIEASLRLSQVAREAVAFLELDKVEVKTLEPNFCHAKAYLFRHVDSDDQKNYYITGSSNLTEAGTGLKATHNVELNLASFGSDPQYNELLNWFDDLWLRPQAHLYKTLIDEKGDKKQVPFKQYLIDEIEQIFAKYSPKTLYFKVLFELFGKDLLLELDDPEFNRQIGRLENTVVFKSLYEFQKKGAMSLIKMLQKHNGAILADAVGLGKTWTALAVIKFYLIEQYKVILLCPKKLEQNWNQYLEHRGSRFEKDYFNYIVKFHTDLNEDLFDRNLGDRFLQRNAKILFVIDESHNLRNDKSARYKFLLEKVLQQVDSPKVLMLSATPVNNTLLDIRNQFKLIVRGLNGGFEDSLDIKSLDFTFKQAQKSFNEWTQEVNPKIGDFINKLPAAFFRLTDALVVARTRHMIQGLQDGLNFPIKNKPENLFVTPKHIGNFESFEELFDHFPPMLSGYQPSYYVDELADKDVLHDEKQRDRFLVKMMYILLVKRLESSWYSFQMTVEKILGHHQNALDRIKAYQQTKKDTAWDDTQLLLFDDDDLQALLEDFTLGKKRKVRLLDIDKSGKLEHYKNDLKADIEALQLLQSNLLQFEQKVEKELKKPRNLQSIDVKLETLMQKIVQKRQNGENGRNPKVLIFTVYKDTAFYLYDQLLARGYDKLAVVSGDGSKCWDETGESKRFEQLLERFAPFTKLYKEKEWEYSPNHTDTTLLAQYDGWQQWLADKDPKTHLKLKHSIDILIATDALSEGQNLQDCDLVVNYDIHWNPVRVIQRMGRIDRLGSPNQRIFGINFWPSKNINSYLNLQDRIEQRMVAMKLAGSEVHLDFSDSFKEMAQDENLERIQKEKMLRQMEVSWDEIDPEHSLGFDNFSLEGFRQELLEELKKNQDYYRNLPNGIYTGFIALPEVCAEQGLIALLGYPSRPAKSKDFIYKGYELLYLNHAGESVFMNQKEVLDALMQHKSCERDSAGLRDIDQGRPQAMEPLSYALKTWLNRQKAAETVQEDGSVKTTMGRAGLDILEKLKTGSKKAIEQIKEEGSTSDKYSPENFDLITWFLVTV